MCEHIITALFTTGRREDLTNPTPAPTTDAPPARAFLFARTDAKKAMMLLMSRYTLRVKAR